MKKVIGIVLGIILVVALTVGGIIFANRSETSSDHEHDYLSVRRIEVNESENQHGVSLNNVISTEESWYYTLVYGEVINDSNQSYSRILLTISFYDENDEFVGYGEGAVWHVNPGSFQLFMVWADENVAISAVSASLEVSEIDIGEYRPLNVIEFSNMQTDVTDDEVRVIGYAENNDLERHSFDFWVGAYDRHGNLVGVAAGTINNLDVAERREFVAHNEAGNILSAVTFRAFISEFIN